MADLNQYDLGDLIELSAIFKDRDLVLADPSSVTLKVKPPSGTVSTFTGEIVNDSVGLYHMDYEPDEVGSYSYKFYGTGNVHAAEEGVFYVRAEKVV